MIQPQNTIRLYNSELAHTVMNLPMEKYNKPNPKVWRVNKIFGVD